MKAISILSPRDMQFIDVPEPECRAHDVLLQIERIGLCGSDLSIYRGANPLVSYPRIPGHEIQARVLHVSKEVKDGPAVGEAVTVLPYTNCGDCSSCRAGRVNACRFNQTLGVQRDGALCERIVVPADRVIRAKGLSDSALALIEPLSVGAHAADRGCIQSGETVMVIGCGMIGLGVIAAAADRGARVIAVDVDDAKLEIAKLAGAAERINSRSESIDTRLSELTAGDGPDVAIEAVGHPETFVACVEHVRFGGRVVFIGYAKDSVAFATKWFILKELDLLGARNATRTDFENVIAMLGKGRYPIDVTITKTIAFADTPSEMAAWDRNPSLVTKIHISLK